MNNFYIFQINSGENTSDNLSNNWWSTFSSFKLWVTHHWISCLGNNYDIESMEISEITARYTCFQGGKNVISQIFTTLAYWIYKISNGKCAQKYIPVHACANIVSHASKLGDIVFLFPFVEAQNICSNVDCVLAMGLTFHEDIISKVFVLFPLKSCHVGQVQNLLNIIWIMFQTFPKTVDFIVEEKPKIVGHNFYLPLLQIHQQ